MLKTIIFVYILYCIYTRLQGYAIIIIKNIRYRKQPSSSIFSRYIQSGVLPDQPVHRCKALYIVAKLILSNSTLLHSPVKAAYRITGTAKELANRLDCIHSIWTQYR